MKRLSIAIATIIAVFSFKPSASLAQIPPPNSLPPLSSRVSPVPWVVIGCAGGVILSAVVASSRDGRELSAPEALSCGVLFWLSGPNLAETTKKVKGKVKGSYVRHWH
ncbi:MAG: hypothetical protein ABI830_13815, partial [Pseudolabrys sp.]